MATNQKSLLRQWHMLQKVPRAPSKITVKELCERLRREDFKVTERTVQRDLKELQEVFPITADERDKPFGWSWQRNASSFDLPGLTVPEALTLTMVEQHLRHHLPPITVDALRPHFSSAARTLADHLLSLRARAASTAAEMLACIARASVARSTRGFARAMEGLYLAMHERRV